MIREAAPAPRRVVIVAFDGVQQLDVAGPMEVLIGANRVTRQTRYRVELAALGDQVTTSSGVRMTTRPLFRYRAPVDTVIVAGGDCLLTGACDTELVAHIGRLARRAERVCSVCSGAILLAATGMLDCRTVTTHWAAAELLSARHPDVHVDADPIFVEDNGVWTSAGVSAAIDLTLALVADDISPIVANHIAQWLVLPARRIGTQSQFAPRRRFRRGHDRVIDDVIDEWLSEPGRIGTVEEMAAFVHLSPRQFTRRFVAATGTTPGQFGLQMRLDHARSLLEAHETEIGTIARQCGFRSHEAFDRAFRRRFGTSPSRHRAEFGLHR